MKYPDLSSAKRIAVDIETCDPHIDSGCGARRGGYIVGVSIATDTGFNEYYPFAHESGNTCDKQTVYKWLNVELGREYQAKVGANLIYDLEHLALAGVQVKGKLYDVQIAEPLLDELAFSYSLGTLATKYLGAGKTEDYLYAALAKQFGGAPTRKAQAGNIWRGSGTLVREYALGDTTLPLRILEKQEVELRKQDLWDLFEMESDLIPILLRMKLRGVAVDIPKAEKTIVEMSKKIVLAESLLEGANINAAASLSRLFDKHGVLYPRTERTNAPSFTKESLAATDHPLARALEEVRGWTKLRDTFVNNYILEGHIDGRLHGQFNQLKSDDSGTVSGRLSSSKPNMQNIPTKGAGVVRAIFIPDKDEDWYSLDYSQVEYRLMAHYALGKGSDALRETYIGNPKVDFHQQMADLTGLERKYAKTLVFGLLYGMGKEKLAIGLKKDMAEAEEIFKVFHKNAPFVKTTSAMASQKARVRGYVYTLLKRRRRFPNGVSVHKALNALLQGSAADIMKKAMVDLSKSGVEDVLGAPLLTVHDELDFSVPRTKAGKEAILEVKNIMINTIPLSVPLLVDIERGTNWANICPEIP